MKKIDNYDHSGPFRVLMRSHCCVPECFSAQGHTTPSKQKDPGEGSSMKNDRLCKRTTPIHTSTACARLPVKNIADWHLHTHQFMLIIMKHLIK